VEAEDVIKYVDTVDGTNYEGLLDCWSSIEMGGLMLKTSNDTPQDVPVTPPD